MILIPKLLKQTYLGRDIEDKDVIFVESLDGKAYPISLAKWISKIPSWVEPGDICLIQFDISNKAFICGFKKRSESDMRIVEENKKDKYLEKKETVFYDYEND